MQQKFFYKLRTVAALALCLSVQSACHKLNLVEQLESPEKRVPIIDENGHLSKHNFEYSLYYHQGNYYTILPVAYARESFDWITEKRLNPWEMTQILDKRKFDEIEAWIPHYFPLSNEEVDACLELPKGSTNQPAVGKITPVAQAPKMKKISAKSGDRQTLFHPQSAKIIASDYYGLIRSDALPARSDERGFTQNLFRPIVYLADLAGNTVLTTAEGCGCVIGSVTLAPFLFLLEPMLEPIYVKYFYAG